MIRYGLKKSLRKKQKKRKFAFYRNCGWEQVVPKNFEMSTNNYEFLKLLLLKILFALKNWTI